MTQAPQPVPAGWYPSPDGAPVQRWWDGQRWTVATWPPAPDAVPAAQPEVAAQAVSTPPSIPAPPTPAQSVSGWTPAPRPSLHAPALLTRILVALAGISAPLAWGGRLWSASNPPAWLTAEVVQALTGAASGFIVVAALFWCWWQVRLVRHYPPGTARRSPGWQIGSWLVPVGNLWMPRQNIAELFRLAGAPTPRWLIVWWLLWVGAILITPFGALHPAVGLAGALLLAGASVPAVLLITRLSTPPAPAPRRAAPDTAASTDPAAPA